MAISVLLAGNFSSQGKLLSVSGTEASDVQELNFSALLSRAPLPSHEGISALPVENLARLTQTHTELWNVPRLDLAQTIQAAQEVRDQLALAHTKLGLREPGTKSDSIPPPLLQAVRLSKADATSNQDEAPISLSDEPIIPDKLETTPSRDLPTSADLPQTFVAPIPGAADSRPQHGQQGSADILAVKVSDMDTGTLSALSVRADTREGAKRDGAKDEQSLQENRLSGVGRESSQNTPTDSSTNWRTSSDRWLASATESVRAGGNTASGNGNAPAIVAAEPSFAVSEVRPVPTMATTSGERTGLASVFGRDNAPLPIQTHLHDPRWSQQFGDRIAWMARGDINNAQIHITPAQLGPIQINISLQGDQMSAQFISASQEVRQVLEDALPRLREMLSGSGINLGQANVGAQQQQRDHQASPQPVVPFAREEAILSDDSSWNSQPAQPLQHGRGLVDLFA